MSQSNTVGDIAALLPSSKGRVRKSLGMLEEHLSENSGYVAWSGGRDSTCVVALARKIQPNIPVVWFDSGLEFPETRGYLERLAKRWDLNYHVIKTDPDALTMLRTTGTWDHAAPYAALGDDMHNVLITEPARQAHEAYGWGEVTGLRAGESIGRRILLASGRGRYARKDGSVVCAPIWRWGYQDVRGFLAGEGVEENPVYARLESLGAPLHAQRVGLVVDGNAAEYGRYTWLRAGWPDMWVELCEALPRLKEWR